MQEAMARLKSEMGADAVILHTRKVQNRRFFGLISREMIEITGAVEEPTFAAKETTLSKLNPSTLQLKPTQTRLSASTIAPPSQPAVGSSFTLIPSSPAPNPMKESDPLKETMAAEMVEIKGMVGEILERLNQPAEDLPSDIHRIHQLLIKNDVELRLADQICSKIMPLDTRQNNQQAIALIQAILGQPKPIVLPPPGNGSHVVMMIGPTGVGKTTTIAKLAATFSIVQKRKVGLITADTYRIAAVEQLRTFGEIIGVPVEVVFSPPTLRTAIERNWDKDLILIDTAGRSHKHERQMEELRAFVEAAQPSSLCLVLSMTTKGKDLDQILNSYNHLNFERIIFTKMDETTQYGTMLQVIQQTGNPLSYVTTGQNVPDDIEIADPAKLARLIFGEMQ
ncbi:flagellar biosynthesis protein FlhF [Heliophilum fasciatum]|nr:flagellar biosynthesis protein FlhF [Heliophilum fasciatum]